MKVENKQLREEFNKYLKDNGVMSKWTAERMSIPESSLSRWRSGHLDFGKEKVATVKEFLLSHNR